MSLRRFTTRGSYRAPSRRFAVAAVDADADADAAAAADAERHFKWLFRDNEWRLVYDDGQEAGLLFTKYERLPLKDFGSEVRAAVDVTRALVKDATLLLDVVQENTPEQLVDLLLKRMAPDLVLDDAKSAIFAHQSMPVLARSIQSTFTNESGVFEYDQSWICTLCNLPSLQRRQLGIARLKHPANMSESCQEGRLFILILCPSKEKGTKSAVETGRTFATMLADVELRRRLLEAGDENEFKKLLFQQAQQLVQDQPPPDDAHAAAKQTPDVAAVNADPETGKSRKIPSRVRSCCAKWCRVGQGFSDDLRRRLPFYWSDFRDGIIGPRTPQKVCSSTMFLYFACILPSIAFGALNDTNTHGRINVKKTIIGQTIGGLFQALFGGQPLLILLTTAPLSLYIKVIYSICEDFDLDFYAFYGCVGLWAAGFLALYSVLDVARLMHWCSRSTEEIFGLFITIAFIVDPAKETAKNFAHYYLTPACYPAEENATSTLNETTVDDDDGSTIGGTLLHYAMDTMAGLHNETGLEGNGTDGYDEEIGECNQASAILFLFLMLCTLWIGLFFFNYTKTPYLQAGFREALADYSLPVAVIVTSFIGSYLFRDVTLEQFKYDDKNPFTPAPLSLLAPGTIMAGAGLGFALSVLIFMDQNISAAMVNSPSNRLKKGPAYHFDLMIVAILNAFLSMFGLPWMHGAVPHAPLHVRSLADVEERVDQGHVYEVIVWVRETRVTGMLSHILIGLSLLLLPYPLGFIPSPVLNGLFLYMGITALNGNQFFERILLFFTEQALYPPSHYMRRVPQRMIHLFTGCQVVQLGVLCIFGFSPIPYMKMVFPFCLLMLLPLRHKIVPLLVHKRYLAALDGHN